MIILQTPRLILRTWEDSDIEPFSAMNQDPEVMKFFPSLLTPEESASRVDWQRRHFQEHGFCCYAMELKSTGEFIGFVGLAVPLFEAPFMPAVEIGWRIARSHWNQGYATEAAKYVLSHAFNDLNLQEVVSFTAVPNKTSQRVMEKIGMTHDPKDDFDHPKLAEGHPLKRHVLYRITAAQIQAKDSIEIETADPAWPAKAQEEISRISKKITALKAPWFAGIEHIGSTAIPELSAKPILDLAIGVKDLTAAKALVPLLIEEGYVFWEANPDKSKLFFAKGMPPIGGKRTHHVHVMEIMHHDWIIRPLFRNYLIAHPEDRMAYQALKQDLSQTFKEDREAYTQSKTAFIRNINLKAVQSHLHFKPLVEIDFSLILKWLEEPHVKAWWDQKMNWTIEKVKEKYASYVNGYKLDDGIKKPMHAYLALIDELPIAYVQFYNAWDFERDVSLDSKILPKSLAALDFYIGEPGFLKKGFAPLVLQNFLSEKVEPVFEHCLVDPDVQNTSAIRAYEKAGFKAIKTSSQNVCWMFWDNQKT